MFEEGSYYLTIQVRPSSVLADTVKVLRLIRFGFEHAYAEITPILPSGRLRYEYARLRVICCGDHCQVAC